MQTQDCTVPVFILHSVLFFVVYWCMFWKKNNQCLCPCRTSRESHWPETDRLQLQQPESVMDQTKGCGRSGGWSQGLLCGDPTNRQRWMEQMQWHCHHSYILHCDWSKVHGYVLGQSDRNQLWWRWRAPRVWQLHPRHASSWLVLLLRFCTTYGLNYQAFWQMNWGNVGWLYKLYSNTYS